MSEESRPSYVSPEINNVASTTLQPTASEYYPLHTYNHNGTIRKTGRKQNFGNSVGYQMRDMPKVNEASSIPNGNNELKTSNHASTFSSTLQPTAPEYYPLNRNYSNGAIKKPSARQKVNFQPRKSYENKTYDRNEHANSFNTPRYSDYYSNDVKTPKNTREKSSNKVRNKHYDYDNQFRSNTYHFNHFHNSNGNHLEQNNQYFTDNMQQVYDGDAEKQNKHGSVLNYSSKYGRGYDTNNFYKDSSSFGRNRYTKAHTKFTPNNGKNGFSFRRSNNGKYENKKKERALLSPNDKNADITGQRERLMDMIKRRALECLVCCDNIKNDDKIWFCVQCYHIIHLFCIVTWANSSKVEENWRCPACQNIYAEVPSEYRCYCGKLLNPKFDPNIIPHGCGDVCLRKGKNCEHKCNILCHPGPCPECDVMVSKPCGCGSTEQIVKCSTEFKFVCDKACSKILNCGIHKCPEKCHSGKCPECQETIIQECYCGKTGRKVICDEEQNGKLTFICDNTCQKLLSCSNHKCQKQCHPGPCDPCERDTHIVKHCACGKTPLKVSRESCLDPIPCCNEICGKLLNCRHTCKEKCHEGTCPVCPLSTETYCRCGYINKKIACKELINNSGEITCEKKCTKKRLCGKHKCNQKCCIQIEHICLLPCNRPLSCGLHRCERTCHSGRCPPCLETSFDELYCECGSSVLYPPIPCGKKPPVCNKPCSKSRQCGHPPNHECHTGACPPCFVLTKQWCYGKHEQRSTIPCHQESFSCGLPCGRPSSCQRHKCIKVCHEGECPTPCTQPCSVPRVFCGHPCSKPCHNPPCPESSCKQVVPVTCQCGLQKSTKICLELTEEYKNIEMAQLKDKINQCDDTSDLSKPIRISVLRVLDCNEDCRIYERNRRLAIGLQIQNPDLSQKLTPRYSDFLKQFAKKDLKFCQRIHEKLTELVQLAKQSKQKSRSHSFESMNRDKRYFIHEYCEYFGVDSEAYDREPNRNVVATAIKDKSWLPSMSLLEVLQRENGQRKVPGPVLSYGASASSESVSLKVVTRVPKP